MAYNYPSPKRDESVIEVLHGKEVSISFDIHCFVRYIKRQGSIWGGGERSRDE